MTGKSAGRGVLDGAFALLDALRRAGGEAGLTEMAVACGVPKGTAHRLLEQLAALGAVERHGRRYVLGPELFRLGQSWQPYPGLRTAARTPLLRVRMTTGASAVLVVLRDGLALTVASVPGRAEPLVPVRDGMAFPLTTAAGLALTSRERGPFVDREGVMPGLCCAALPVRGRGGRVVAALAALAPADQPPAPLTAAVAGAAAAVGDRLTRADGPWPDCPAQAYASWSRLLRRTRGGEAEGA
ncbi:helix-turn-helix domain-containing protein [Streptomyces sp. NPDC093801]|uniref:IclR family transcriptional regulator n=1 Tax=Streptomyces sp. NPDC093801 TaxID=3155203 RepID=UPI00344E4B03